MSTRNAPAATPEPHGTPSLYSLTSVSTDQFEPSIRYEAWRSAVFYDVDLLPYAVNELSGTAQFVRGNSGGFGSYDGSVHHTCFSATSRRSGLGDCMVIQFMQSGSVHLEDAGGAELLAPEGSLALYDIARPMHYRWSKGGGNFILLPRSVAIHILGGSIRGLSLPLDNLPLSAFLRSQMQLLGQQAHQLARHELAAMLDATLEMATLVLASAVREQYPTETSAIDGLMGGLYASALRYIELNYARADLNPTEIASGLGCSRATLYRAFAAHGGTVMDALREFRLDRARSSIEGSPQRSISSLAMACGFIDASTFGRQFKARFGVQATEWREAARLPRQG